MPATRKTRRKPSPERADHKPPDLMGLPASAEQQRDAAIREAAIAFKNLCVTVTLLLELIMDDELKR